MVQTDLSSAQAIDQLSAMIERQNKWVFSQADDTLEFRGSLLNNLFPPIMRAMSAVNKGELRIHETSEGLEVSYDFEVLELLVFAAIAWIFFFLVVASNEGLVRGLGLASICFLWIFGGKLDDGSGEDTLAH